MDYDLIVKGGWVIDGSGGPAFRADVAIQENMIFEVGHLGEASARKELDATGLYVGARFH